MTKTGIEQYNRRLLEKKHIVSKFIICPVCRVDKFKDRSNCGKSKCPYNLGDNRGRPRKTD